MVQYSSVLMKEPVIVMQKHPAQRALEAYPITSPDVTFLRHNENMAFRVDDKQTGNSYLLRIHAPLTAAFEGERFQPQGIISELRWLETLSQDTNLTLQHPVHTKNGELLTTISEQNRAIPCSLLSWIEAEPFPTTPSLEQVTHLGTLLAALHTHARQWSIPDNFTRPIYDLTFYRQQMSLLTKGVLSGIIQVKDFAVIQETLEQVFSLLAQIHAPHLLIHADLHRGNLLTSHNNVYPIDFSLCGFGSPLFDLGTCLPCLPASLRPVLLEAYQQQETLPSAYSRLIDAYFLLSRAGAYVYLLANQSEHEWLKERIPRFSAQECRMFLEGQALLLGGNL